MKKIWKAKIQKLANEQNKKQKNNNPKLETIQNQKIWNKI